jgi:hypothetical protein
MVGSRTMFSFRTTLRHVSLATVAVTVATSLPSDAAANPQTFSLVCRGGGRLDVELHPNTKELMLNYRYSKVAPSVTDLPEGACRWWDREISASEPSALRIIPKTDDERFLADDLGDCFRDPGCQVTIQAHNNSSFLIPDFQRPFTYRRAK